MSSIDRAVATIESRRKRIGISTVSRTKATNDACDSFAESAGRKTSTAPLAPPESGTSE